MSDMHSVILAAMAGIGCPAGREPVKDRPETYISWFEVDGRESDYASNGAAARTRLVQVDLYTVNGTDALREEIMTRMKAAGFRVAGWGPEMYERDTRYRHLPMTFRWKERFQ